MADLLPTALRLAPAERQLTHAVCYFAASTMDETRRDTLAREMKVLLTGLAPRPETEALIEAARQLVLAYPRRRSPGGGPDWCHATFAAERVALSYHWAAFAHLSGGR